MKYTPTLRASEGGRHSEVVSEIGKMYSRGYSYEEVKEIIMNESKNQTPPLQEKEIESILKSTKNFEKGEDYRKRSNYKEPKKEIDISNKTQYEWKFIKNYPYKDKNNNLIFSKTKYEIIDKNTGEKIEKQFTFKDHVNNVNKLDKLTIEQKSLLYNLQSIEKAKKEKKTIYLVEGEKDADTLSKYGLIATSLKTSGESINDYYKYQLQGINSIYIIPDYDETGIKTAIKRYGDLKHFIKNVSVLRWDFKTPKKYDITDLIEEKNLNKNQLSSFLEANKGEEIPDYYLDLIDKKPKPKDQKELFNLFENIGYKWREENKKESGEPLKMQPYTIAKLIYENTHVVLLLAGFDKKNSPLAIYNPSKGIYEIDDSTINVLMNCLQLGISKNKQSEVHNQLRILLQRKSVYRQIETDPNFVIFGNGIYNRKYNVLEPFTPRKVFTSKVVTDYNPNAKLPKFDDWDFEKWINEEISENNPEKLILLWQIMASVIQPNRNNKSAFLLYDKKSNTGKSTFSQLLINLVGAENTSTLDLKEIEDKFYPSTAEGKALIVGDDNDRRMYLDKSNNLKRITSGEPMAIQRKGKDGYNTVFNTTVIQSMNGIPKFGTIDQGLLNRLVFVCFKHQYSQEKGNLNINVKRKYIKDKRLLEYIVKEAIKINVDEIIKTKESNYIIDNLADTSDTAVAFVNEMIDEFSSKRIPIDFLFTVFNYWCKNIENVKPKLRRNQFKTRIEEAMEEKGWEYNKYSKLSKDFDIDKDIQILDDILNNSADFGINDKNSIYERYKNMINNNKGCPLFIKVENLE